MKQKLLLILGLVMGLYAQAQVVITLQLPPLGLTIKPQLWNMSLINTTGASMTAQLQMVMTDAGTGQTVLTATTPTFLLPAGVKAINANSVSPVAYTARTSASRSFEWSSSQQTAASQAAEACAATS